MIKWANLIQDKTLQKFNERITQLALGHKITQSHMLRTDGTTVVALCPTNPSEAHRQFCFYDSATGRRQEGAEIDQHLIDYQFEPGGRRILGIDINHQAADNNNLLEFRLFDWNGKSGPVLASAPAVNRFAESPDSRYFAYIVDHIEDAPCRYPKQEGTFCTRVR